MYIGFLCPLGILKEPWWDRETQGTQTFRAEFIYEQHWDCGNTSGNVLGVYLNPSWSPLGISLHSMAHIVNSDISGLPKDANVSCTRRWSLHAAIVINILQKTSDLSQINKKWFQWRMLQVSLAIFSGFPPIQFSFSCRSSVSSGPLVPSQNQFTLWRGDVALHVIHWNMHGLSTPNADILIYTVPSDIIYLLTLTIMQLSI